MKRSVKNLALAAALSLSAVSLASSAFAGSVLVSEMPWGQDGTVTNMNAVFGAGNYTQYGSYGSATASSVFTSANKVVVLDGGASTDTDLQNYLNANAPAIANWLFNGGRMLIQSAGWDQSINFGPFSLNFDPSYSLANSTGTLTAAGQAAFTFFPEFTNQSGNYLSHDTVSGPGLTTLMTGDQTGTPIIAGEAIAAGYLMMSGLTDSEWNNYGPNLASNEIAYLNGGIVSPAPLPAALPMFGAVVAGVAFWGRRRRKTA